MGATREQVSAECTKLDDVSAYVQIRNVPEETRRTLKARATSSGESFNTYLLNLLEREASRPTVAEVLARAATREERAEVSSVDAIREARSEREVRSRRKKPRG